MKKQTWARKSVSMRTLTDVFQAAAFIFTEFDQDFMWQAKKVIHTCKVKANTTVSLTKLKVFFKRNATFIDIQPSFTLIPLNKIRGKNSLLLTNVFKRHGDVKLHTTDLKF